MESVIRGEFETNPLIVYVDSKVKANRVKQICNANNVPHWSILDDNQLERTLGIVSGQSKGLICALPKYGRGCDIRFKEDSRVVIGYKPERLETVKQMTGRSSRKMKSHHGILICIDPNLDNDGVK